MFILKIRLWVRNKKKITREKQEQTVRSSEDTDEYGNKETKKIIQIK